MFSLFINDELLV